jgi:arsenite-transporting ATPase
MERSIHTVEYAVFLRLFLEARRQRPPPAAIGRTEAPYTFAKRDGHYEVRLQLPFAAKGEVGLFKKGDELVVEIGTLRRHIGLPTSMAGLSPSRAKLENRILTVEMKES